MVCCMVHGMLNAGWIIVWYTDMQVKVVQKERYKRVYEDIMKQLDRLENDYLPQVSLTQREVRTPSTITLLQLG